MMVLFKGLLVSSELLLQAPTTVTIYVLSTHRYNIDLRLVGIQSWLKYPPNLIISIAFNLIRMDCEM